MSEPGYSTVWVIVDIGCIECGDPNDEPIAGVYRDERRARDALAKIRSDLERDYVARRGYNTPIQEHELGFSTSGRQWRLIEAAIQ